MSLQLHRIQDPRDSLERARRSELVEFAKNKGISEIVPEMPAILMRKILRSRGMTDIRIEPRQLGEMTRTKINAKVSTAKPAKDRTGEPPKIVEVDAEADLLRQWKVEQTTPTATEAAVAATEAAAAAAPRKQRARKEKGPTPTDPKLMHMSDLRRHAKEKGVSITFKMKKAEILQMLEVIDG